ncbi:MAG TPA: choice-of-anchor P family protein [Gemmatimonadales bacterium]|jgi:hypothetical protein|nr:choice-of-anchor P family protein [Gemmatimonadales bacterium]
MTNLKLFAAFVGMVSLGGTAAAQTVNGKAFGTYVNAAGVTTQSPVASLPSSGGMDVGSADAFGVPSALDAKWLSAITTGAVDSPASTAQSTSELENVSVLSGLITADVVTAVASSYRNATGAASDAQGSGFVNLIVNGLAVTSDVAPNTRVNLPGVGYAILNEQSLTGDGISSSGMTVNMIHVYLQSLTSGTCTPLGCLPDVLTTTGEIIVGSASSGVR